VEAAVKLSVAALAILLAWPALAQQGPSFDCAKASNEIERTICKDAALAEADREMVAAYTTLAGRLDASAKQHLQKDQSRWISARNGACAGDTDGIAVCLKNRYAARTATLRALAGADYPFVSEQTLYKSGKLGKVAWSYDIAYPQFDATTADFSALNAKFAATARKAAADATPKAADGIDREQQWNYEQGFRVSRPTARAVLVTLDFYGFSGGAHGYGATTCTLVDMRSGKSAGPEAVFAEHGQWRDEMVRLVGADLRKQFVEKPGFEDALQPAKLAELLREPGHYCWRAADLLLVFNQYEVGPYAAGRYLVEIGYDKLRSFFRGDGPLTR
jgi:uncharacterized protein